MALIVNKMKGTLSNQIAIDEKLEARLTKYYGMYFSCTQRETNL